MKKVKIWVLALLLVMLFSATATMVNPTVSFKHDTTALRADVETIHGVFKIDQNTTDPLTGEKGKYGFDSSVIVASDGTLIIENATLYFLSDIAHPRSLTVYGSFILYNSTLTLSSNQIQPYYHLNVTIDGSQNAAAKVKIEKSMILYDGWFNVTSKSTNIIIKDSVFDRMSTNTYGPTPYFKDSVVLIENTSFNSLFEHSSGGPVYIGNMTDSTGTTATPSTTGELTHWVSNPDPEYASYWNKVPVKELQIFVNYNTSADYDNSSELLFIYRDVVLMRVPLTLSVNDTVADADNTTFSSADLKASDIQDKINSGEIKVEVSEVHYRGNVNVKSVVMRFLIEKNVIDYGIERFDFNIDHSTIYARDLHVAADFELNYGTTHNRISLYDNSKLYVLNLTVENTPNKQDSCIYVDDASSQVYIFRYAKIRVTFNNIPLGNLYVNATSYMIDQTLRSTVMAETQNYIDNMHFGNYTGNTLWAITDGEGYAYLPLMSDIVNQSEWPNSRYVGVYNMWVNKTANNTNYYTAQIAVDHFPNLQVENNTFEYNAVLSYYKHVDIGVSMSVTTPAPYITGNDVDISVDVTNHGTEVANNVNVYVYVNNVMVNSTQVYSLNPSQTIPLAFTIDKTAFKSDGEYNITVMAIQKWDTNPNNNVSTTTIRVGRISVNQWGVDKLINRHSANITVSVYSFYSIPNTEVSLYIDSTQLRSWPSLYSGENDLTYLWNVNGTPAGDHILYLYVNSTLISHYPVHVYKDVDVGINSISISPPDIYVSEETTVIVNATNYGLDTPSGTSLNVRVYDPYDNIVMENNVSFTFVGSHQVSVNFVPSINGLYRVEVKVVSSEDYNPSNDFLSMPFEVKPTPYDVTPLEEYTFVNGTTVKVDVTITSSVDSSINVYMYVQPLNITIVPSNFNNPVQIPKNGKVMAEFNIEQNVYQELLRGHITYPVMYFIKISSNKTMSNNTFGPFYFTLKEKANFEVVPGSLVIVKDNEILNNLNVAEGVIVQVKFMVRNTGGIPGNVTYSIMDGKNSLKLSTINLLGPGVTYNVTYNYTIMGVGSHVINVTLNPKQNVSEVTYADNVASASVMVVPPAMEIAYSVSSDEHNDKIYDGDHVVVLVRVINVNATNSQGKNVYMSGVTVTVNFGALGTYRGVTNSAGVARIEFVASRSGHYTPTISAEYHGAKQSVSGSSYTIMEKPLMEQIPWLWVIVGAIALGVGLFFLYGYISFKKEAKEYMICGNCGHLIPADAERCPYCGAVFEKDKVQCPDCGSWIDEDSKFCPVCGSVFMSSDDPEYDKYVSLKERYEQYLTKYKEEAKKYIGENFTQEEFFKWWKTHPEFISFLEWVKRQEEEIEGETVKCPVCGALNPKGAKVCRVCGSPLPGAEGEKESEEHPDHTIEAERGEKEDDLMKQYKEEYEKLQHPGVVSFEEWVKRKRTEEGKVKSEKEEAKKEQPKAASASKEKPVEEKVKEGYIKCPVCGALNKPDAKVCAVCGAPLTGVTTEKEEKAEKQSAPSKPVVKKKVIKKVIKVNEEEKK